MKKAKKIMLRVCAIVGIVDFFALSGVVPENPNMITQGLVCLAIMIICIVEGCKCAE